MFDSCICVEPDEVCELLSESFPVARKEHRCCECGATIPVGEKYLKETVKEPSYCRELISTFLTCMPCYNIRRTLFTCGWYYQCLWEEIHEAYCDEETCICPR